MTIPSEPRTPRLYHAGGDSAFTPLEAIGVLTAAMGSFLLSTALVRGAGGSTMVALVIGELMLVAVPLATLKVTKRPLAVFGFRRPAPIYLLAGVLIGSTGWYLNMRLVELLPLPEGRLSSLQQAVEGPPLVLALLTIAVVPAVCEELLFRGVVLRAFASRFVPYVAIILSSLVFAAYHLSVVQFIPTLTLGLVLGVLAWRAASVIPAMLAHVLNNALAILVAREELPDLTRLVADNPNDALTISAITTAFGLVLVVRGPS